MDWFRRTVGRLLLALVFLSAAPTAAAAPGYAVGQVWEYRTRPGDEGSILKIQAIETAPVSTKLGPIYHVSVSGFHFRNPQMLPVLPHAPVSRETLDASVTRLSDKRLDEFDFEAGIAEWRAANGGVFTISVAEIVELMDQQTAHVGE